MNEYNDLNEVISCRLWQVRRDPDVFEAEARVYIPHLTFVNSTSLEPEPTMRRLEEAIRHLGFTGEIEWVKD